MLITFIMSLVCISAVTAALSESLPRSTISNNQHRYSTLIYDTIAFNSVNASFISQDPDPAEPGKYVTLRFKIENLGSEKTPDLYFRLKTDYPLSFDTLDSEVVHVGTMLPRQFGANAAILKFTVRVDKSAVQGTTYVDLVQYANKNESNSVISKDFPIIIKNFDSILEVKSVKVTPEMVAPGAKGTVTITLKNLADSYLDDIRITTGFLQQLTTASSINFREIPLTPIGDTNEKVIEHLTQGQIQEVRFDFIVDADAEPKIYKLPLTLAYSDSSGRNYSKSLLFGVIIGDTPDIAVTLDDTDIYTAGSKGTVTVKFVNRGLTNVKLVYVNLVDNPGEYDILSADGVYVGNIDSDDYETADFNLFVKGDVKNAATLRLNLKYRDVNNNLHDEQKELKVRLYSSSEAKKYGFVQSSNGSYIVVVIILLIIGFFAWRYFRKKPKKQ